MFIPLLLKVWRSFRVKKKLQQAVEHANETNTTKKKTAQPSSSKKDKLQS